MTVSGERTRRSAIGGGWRGGEDARDIRIDKRPAPSHAFERLDQHRGGGRLQNEAPLHDLGKIGIPDAILLKPAALTDHELRGMQTHATIGGMILAGSGSPLPEIAAEIALTHHERWDGTGYPAGLIQEQIPVSGRIVGLVDAFDAMTHHRPYREAVSVAEAVAEVMRSSGIHFDPVVVDAFLRLDPFLLNSPPLPAPRTLAVA